MALDVAGRLEDDLVAVVALEAFDVTPETAHSASAVAVRPVKYQQRRTDGVGAKASYRLSQGRASELCAQALERQSSFPRSVLCQAVQGIRALWPGVESEAEPEVSQTMGNTHRHGRTRSGVEYGRVQ